MSPKLIFLTLGSICTIYAQDVFSSNGQPSPPSQDQSCPRGTRRFYPSTVPYNPADGCLTPGQAYMRYGRGFPATDTGAGGGDIFSTGGPLLAQQPQQPQQPWQPQQGGITNNQQIPQPPLYPQYPQYPAPQKLPNPRLRTGTSTNNRQPTRQPQTIDWKPYVKEVGKRLDDTQDGWLRQIDQRVANHWRNTRVRADANFTTYPNGAIGNIVVTSQNADYKNFITQLLQAHNGSLPAFPKGTAQTSTRVGWSFTVNQNFHRNGTTLERK